MANDADYDEEDNADHFDEDHAEELAILNGIDEEDEEPKKPAKKRPRLPQLQRSPQFPESGARPASPPQLAARPQVQPIHVFIGADQDGHAMPAPENPENPENLENGEVALMASMSQDELEMTQQLGTQFSELFPNVCQRLPFARRTISYVVAKYVMLNYSNPRPFLSAISTGLIELGSRLTTEEQFQIYGVICRAFRQLPESHLNQSLNSHHRNLDLAVSIVTPTEINFGYCRARGAAITYLNHLRDDIPSDWPEAVHFRDMMMNAIRIILGTIDDSYHILMEQAHFSDLQSDLWANREHAPVIDELVDDPNAWIRESSKNSRILLYAVWFLAMHDYRRGPAIGTVYEPMKIKIDNQWIPTGVYQQKTGPDGQPIDFGTLVAMSVSMPPASIDPGEIKNLRLLRTTIESKVCLKWVNEKLAYDQRVLTYAPVRYLLAFRNGIYNALTDVFIRWEEITTWPDNVGHYIDEEMPQTLFVPEAYPLMNAHGIPKNGEIDPELNDDVLDAAAATTTTSSSAATTAARGAIGATIDDDQAQSAAMPVPAARIVVGAENPIWFSHFFKPHLRYFMRLFEFQSYGDAEFLVFAGLQGRVFTGIANTPQSAAFCTSDGATFTIPRFGVATNVYGVAGNGKSMLLQMISEMVPGYKLGVLESREEEHFGRDELFLNDIWVLILDELEPDSNLSRGFMKKAITGQKQKTAQKYRVNPVRGILNAPFCVGSNFKSIFPRDDAGAFTRRFVYFAFKKPIPPDSIIDDIDIRMRSELPTFIVLCARALALMMRLSKHKSIWTIMPQSLIKERDEIASESNAALAFLTTGLPRGVTRDPAGYRGEIWMYKKQEFGNVKTYYRGPYMTLKELEKLFNAYCHEIGARPYRVQWDMVLAKLPASPTIMRLRMNPCNEFGISKQRSDISTTVVLGIGWDRPHLRERLQKGSIDNTETWVDETHQFFGANTANANANDNGAGVGEMRFGQDGPIYN